MAPPIFAPGSKCATRVQRSHSTRRLEWLPCRCAPLELTSAKISCSGAPSAWWCCNLSAVHTQSFRGISSDILGMPCDGNGLRGMLLNAPQLLITSLAATHVGLATSTLSAWKPRHSRSRGSASLQQRIRERLRCIPRQVFNYALQRSAHRFCDCFCRRHCQRTRPGLRLQLNGGTSGAGEM